VPYRLKRRENMKKVATPTRAKRHEMDTSVIGRLLDPHGKIDKTGGPIPPGLGIKTSGQS
jgi:hypothetical protein